VFRPPHGTRQENGQPTRRLAELLALNDFRAATPPVRPDALGLRDVVIWTMNADYLDEIRAVLCIAQTRCTLASPLGDLLRDGRRQWDLSVLYRPNGVKVGRSDLKRIRLPSIALPSYRINERDGSFGP